MYDVATCKQTIVIHSWPISQELKAIRKLNLVG